MGKFVCSAALLVMTSMLCAQEVGALVTTAPLQESTTVTVTATTQKGDVIAAILSAEDTRDGGQMAIDLSLERGKSVAEEVAAEKGTADAEARVRATLEKLGLGPGYSMSHKAIIVVESATMKVENPETNRNFMRIRESLTTYAVQNAKAQIIRAISLKFSASEYANTFRDYKHDAVEDAYLRKRSEIESRKEELSDLMARINEADSEIISKLTLGDRFDALLDGVIKRVDSEYNPRMLEARKVVDLNEKREIVNQLKIRAGQLLAEYRALQEEAKTLPKRPTLEAASKTKTLSELTLLGSSVIAQAESWRREDKVYTVAVAMVWSPKLQAVATKIGTGDFSSGEEGKLTISEWATAQDWEVVIGPRHFTDKDGRNFFIGISAIEKVSGVQFNVDKKIAEDNAKKYVALLLESDLKTRREVESRMKVYQDAEGNSETGFEEKLTEALMGEVNLAHYVGCSQLMAKTLVHPISRREIYVVAMYLDPTIARESQVWIRKLSEDTMRIATRNKVKCGSQQGMWKESAGGRKSGLVVKSVNKPTDENTSEPAATRVSCDNSIDADF